MPNDKSNPSHQLLVVIDPTGRKLIEKLFETYIRREKGSYKRLPEFMLAVDRCVSEFGGEPLPPDEEDDHDPNDAEPGYDDDEDIHEEDSSEVDSVKMAIASVLASEHTEEQHPQSVQHQGKKYWRTGKLGTGIKPENKGHPMAEYRNRDNGVDSRVWHNLKTNKVAPE